MRWTRYFLVGAPSPATERSPGLRPRLSSSATICGSTLAMWAVISPCWERSMAWKTAKRSLRLASRVRISAPCFSETSRYIASEATIVAPRLTATITARRNRPTFRFIEGKPHAEEPHEARRLEAWQHHERIPSKGEDYFARFETRTSCAPQGEVWRLVRARTHSSGT